MNGTSICKALDGKDHYIRLPPRSKLPDRRSIAELERWLEAAHVRFETGFALAEVTRRLRLAFDQRMRGVGLTGTTWRVLVYLSREGGQTQASLAQRLEISRVAVGEIVDRLERSGHVERRGDPMDRRKWRVHLTQASVDLLPTVFTAASELQAECFSGLTDLEVGQLHALLARLRERLVEMKIGSAG